MISFALGMMAGGTVAVLFLCCFRIAKEEEYETRDSNRIDT